MHFKVHQLTMYKYWRSGILAGRTSVGTTPEEYFGFSAFDVDQLHHYKAGEGLGTWFRLLDGRVVDWKAQPSDPDPSLYNATIN